MRQKNRPKNANKKPTKTICEKNPFSSRRPLKKMCAKIGRCFSLVISHQFSACMNPPSTIACAQSSPDARLAHQSSLGTNPPSTKRHSSSLCSPRREAQTHSLLTKPRHARIHHPPRGSQADCAHRQEKPRRIPCSPILGMHDHPP